MTIEQARERMKMSRREVSQWLEIPYRTLTGWENGERACPAYIEKLIVEKILRGKGIEENEKNVQRRTVINKPPKPKEELLSQFETVIFKFLSIEQSRTAVKVGWTNFLNELSEDEIVPRDYYKLTKGERERLYKVANV